MADAAEAEVNPDGTASGVNEEYGAGAGGEGGDGPNTDTGGDDNDFAQDEEGYEPPKIEASGSSTALFVVLAVIFLGSLVAILYYVNKKKKEEALKYEFFDRLEESQFNIRLPPPVDEYYKVKDAVISKGWQPGQGKPSQETNKATPGRELGQALMKRAIADIPLIHHMQKEAQGMYRLHAKNMCSEVQWRTFQQAEQMVSGEVEEVRAEADQIEPGWSQVIWRQAAQYHGMLKQKHEAEVAQKRAEMAKAAGIPLGQGQPGGSEPELSMAEKERRAEMMAKQLLAQEEKKKAKGGGGGQGSKMQKGFLDKGKGGGKKK